MELKKIKERMESLWKETFKDSSAYVSLIFNTYFDSSHIAFIENDSSLESALLGIPYDFRNSEGITLKALYLCGLSTAPEFRHKGNMSRLLEEINVRAIDMGFDFTFLIPADEGIREFYKQRGYYDSFYKIESNFVPGHKFCIINDSYLAQQEKDSRDEIINFLQHQSISSIKNGYYIIHTREDWNAIMEEALISKSPVYVLRVRGEIKGVAFCGELVQSDKHYLRIKKIVASNVEAKESILGHIAAVHHDRHITVVSDLAEEDNLSNKNIWDSFYANKNLDDSEYEDISQWEVPYNINRAARSFGMVRFLDIVRLLKKTNIMPEWPTSGLNEEEIIAILLRKYRGNESGGLTRLLGFPELSLSMSLVLE